jgi:sigma-E factor negative regulatory protein RseA
MKQRISELMDGELEGREAAGPLAALRDEGEAREAWRSYHLIGDAMRDTRMLSAGFAARVAAGLEKEPTVISPGRFARARQRPRWQMLSAAASVAAVALVGWVAFGLQDGAPQLAQAPQQNLVPKAGVQAIPAAASVAAQVSPPDTANDYLYAHQGYSPRNSLQGVAPYVRTVSGKALVRKQ